MALIFQEPNLKLKMNEKNQEDLFQNFLDQFKLSFEIKKLPVSTKTAKQASEAIGCPLAQIAKSIIFKTRKTQEPILVIASGINHINEEKIAEKINQPIEIAEASFVLEKTGYVIGGVPPFGHLQKIKTFIDKDLIKWPKVWVAAGSPQAVFEISTKELIKISEGEIIEIN